MPDLHTDSSETRSLLDDAQGGDSRALDRLFRRHRRYLARVVELRMDPNLRLRVDPSDVVQESQLEAARRVSQYLDERPIPFRLWLRQIAIDRLLMLPVASVVLLANALSEEGSVEQAVMVLRTAHRGNPGDLRINLLLAVDLHKLSKWDEMLHFAEIAHALRPSSGAALLSIADALRHKGAPQEAVDLCEEVIQLNPDNPHAYEMLGLAREDQRDWDNAVTHFRKAIELHPAYVEAYNHLGRCLTRKGEFKTAIGELRRAIELKPQYAGPHENLARDCERMMELESKLANVLASTEPVADAQARADYAMLCYFKRLFATAARFYEQAFTEEPELAENFERAHRYTAACAAALAGCGQGEDPGATAIDDRERYCLRQQALDWLRAELAQHASALKSRDQKDRQPALTQLHHSSAASFTGYSP